MQMTKKLMALLLAALLAFGTFAMTAGAAGPTPGGGGGVIIDPNPGAEIFGFGEEPTAVTGLVADGTAQTLITAGSTEYGTPYYYATTDNLTGEQANALFSYPSKPGSFSTALPTGTDAGTYYVWYAIDGGSQYVDELPYMEINGEYVRNELTVTIASPAHTHDGITFEPWTSANSLPTNGSYYLTQDVSMSHYITISGTERLNLCLNGHTISRTGSGPVFVLNQTAEFNLFDEAGNHGVITGGTGTAWGSNGASLLGGAIFVYGIFNMHGGTISGNTAHNNNIGSSGGGVAVYRGAEFNMFGGVISGNTSSNGGGVVLNNNSCANIYDGTITGNTGYFGGGVCVASSTLNLYGGTITGNTSDPALFPDYNETLTAGGADVFSYGNSTVNLYGTTIGGQISSTHPITIRDDLVDKVYEVSLIDASNKYDPKIGAITSGLDGYGTLDNFANGSGTGFALVSNASGEAEFTVAYTVTWNNWDGTTLKTEDVAADTVPVYDGATPTRAADDTYSYTFSGWSPTVSAVTGDVTYTAQFTPTATHAHDGVVFTAWTNSSDLPVSGSYYLTTDVTRQTTKVVTGELNLCLNGHTVTYNGTDGMIYYIRNGGTLNLYDAQGDRGVLTGGNRVQQGGAIYVQGTGSTFNMYGGTISGNSSNSGPFDTCGGGVAALNGAEFNMYGGVITDNVSANGGGVALTNATGNIYGGTISGNTAYFGGGVYASDSAVLNLRGGTITGNTATDEVIPYPDLNHGFVPGGDDVFGNSTSVINLYGTTVGGKISSTDPIEIKDDLGSKVYEVSLVDSADKYNPKAGVITNGLSGKGTLANFTNGSGTDFALLTDASGEARFAPAFNTVTWNNWDGGNLETDTNVAAGSTPSYDGAAPAKAGDAEYVYTFSGWSDGTNTYGVGDTLPAVIGDVTYTAAFTSVRKIALTLNVGENGTVTAGSGTYGNASDAANSAVLPGSLEVTNRSKLILEYDHTVNIVEGASITVQTGGTFTFYPASDNTGVITAVPAEGYAFTGWYNGETLYAEGAILEYRTLSESVTLTAKFEELPAGTVAGVTISGTTTYYSDFAPALAAWTADSTLTLYADVTTTAPIDVSESKTLDLNGHGITYTGSSQSEVIAVGTSGANNITLTMRDSAPQTAHKYSVHADGLAVVDEANGTQTFTGGYITGGTGGRNAGNAGGVYVYGPSGGSNTFLMQGGNILGNTAAQLGSGVFLMQGGVFLMQGGSIFGNVGQGGTIGVLGGTATISDGSIRNNKSTDGGSAIYLLNGVVNLNGGEIRDNSAADADGGAIYYIGGTLNLSGAPVFDGNTDPNGELDIRNTASANKIHVTGTLDESVRIGVKSFTTQWNSDAMAYDLIVFTDTAFTTGLAENGSASNFYSADPEYKVVADAAGEATLKSAKPNDQQFVTIDDQISITLSLDLGTRGVGTDAVSITLAGNAYDAQPVAAGNGIYNYKVEMAPAQINDEIVVTIEGDADPLTTSVRAYCRELSKPEYGATANELVLAHAMLFYGQAANNVFLGGADDIANLERLNKDAVQSASVTFNDGTGKVTGASFMALTKPEFRFYTANIDEQTAYGYNQAGIEVEMANASQEQADALNARFVRKADGKVLLEVTGVLAENMDKVITVTINALGQTITFNGNAFAKAMANPNNDEAQQNLGAALYNYGVAAKRCFGA